MATAPGTATTMVTGVGPRPNPKGPIVKPLNLLLVRDDGYLCMGNEDILQLNPRLRIYRGKVTDTAEQIAAFLHGQEALEQGTALPQTGEDVTRMSRERLIEFAMDEYGVKLDPKIEYAHALVAVIKARDETEKMDREDPPKGIGLN